jgi:factor associated with neutral sphingomyelinase activation
MHLESKPNSLLTIGQDGFLKIFDAGEKVCIKSFKICDFVLSSIAIVKTDETFAIGSWDNNIYLFNIVYGSRSKPFPAHDNSITDLIYLTGRKKIVTCSMDCSIKTFRYVGNILDSEEQLWDHDNQISCLAATQDETILSFGDI